jgi:hypothetical protein
VINFGASASSAALSITLLLQCCHGQPGPAFRQDIDVSDHLRVISDSTWTEDARPRATAVLGADSVTVEWTTMRQGAHRGISRISVFFPPHSGCDRFSASLSGPHPYGSRDAIEEGARTVDVETLTVDVERKRTGLILDQTRTVTFILNGDGTSNLDSQ